jgi:hypothetical protein
VHTCAQELLLFTDNCQTSLFLISVHNGVIHAQDVQSTQTVSRGRQQGSNLTKHKHTPNCKQPNPTPQQLGQESISRSASGRLTDRTETTDDTATASRTHPSPHPSMQRLFAPHRRNQPPTPACAFLFRDTLKAAQPPLCLSYRLDTSMRRGSDAYLP